MTQNQFSGFSIPFTRHVARVKLIDSRKLARSIAGPSTLPSGPILMVSVDAPPVGLSGRVGLTAIEGCDMFFFDIQADGKYFCNVASAGDPKVIAAMRYWGATGVMPVFVQTKGGTCGIVRRPFKLHDAFEKAFADSDRKDYLSEFQSRFKELLEPGAMEAVVAARTGLSFTKVHVGFLATVHTQPGLDPIS